MASAGLFLWGLFQLVWTLLLGAPPIQVTTVVGNNASNTLAAPQLPISSFHIFGRIGESMGSVPAAPDTSLKLTLRGIVGGKDPEDGIAIIADANAKERHYTVGQSVADTGAILSAVYSDRVILNISGRQETLKWPKLAGATLGRAAPEASALPQPPSPSYTASEAAPLPGQGDSFIRGPMNMTPFQAVREEVLRDPNAFLKQVQVVPQWENGNLAGVKLSFSGDPALAEQAGLLPTDVIVAVNGTRIDSIDQGLKVAESLRSATSISVIVRRDGREVPLPPIALVP
jgi:general secretion pathway protein C